MAAHNASMLPPVSIPGAANGMTGMQGMPPPGPGAGPGAGSGPGQHHPAHLSHLAQHGGLAAQGRAAHSLLNTPLNAVADPQFLR